MRRGFAVVALAAGTLAGGSPVATAHELRDATNALVPVGTTITATDAGGIAVKRYGVTEDSCSGSTLTMVVSANSWSTFPSRIADITGASFTGCASGLDPVTINLPWGFEVRGAVSGGVAPLALTGFGWVRGGGLGTWTGDLVNGLSAGTVRWLSPGVAGNVCASGRANIDLINARNLARVSPFATGGALNGDWCLAGNSAGAVGIKIM